jgi:hypothetical protein
MLSDITVWAKISCTGEKIAKNKSNLTKQAFGCEESILFFSVKINYKRVLFDRILFPDATNRKTVRPVIGVAGKEKIIVKVQDARFCTEWR